MLKKKRINIKISKDIVDRLDKIYAGGMLTRNRKVEKAINDFIKKEKKVDVNARI